MTCPVCNNPMLVLELNQVEIDYCAKCGGIWLDSGELELLVENDEEMKILLKSSEDDTSGKEKSFPCPICRKKMGKILIGEKNKVLIDRCRKDHGFWFDKGELSFVIQNTTEGSENKVLNLLKDMFKNSTKEK